MRLLKTQIKLFVAVALMFRVGDYAKAGPLNPSDFASLGPNPFTASGTVNINTASTPPVLTNANSTTINGVVSNGIAVFTFDQITIGAGVTVNGVRNAGSRPLALLSHGGITNAGTINLSGGAGETGIGDTQYQGVKGGNAGPGGGGGGGGGSLGAAGAGGFGYVNGGNASPGGDYPQFGGGGAGGSVEPGGGGAARLTGTIPTDGGGGAFGGNGGNSIEYQGQIGPGGTNYGDLGRKLEGGSGGAGGSSSDHFSGGGGGGGGGAVEIGALGNISLGGMILASGGNGLESDFSGGGGAGGGILVHAQTVSLTGYLNASGGFSSPRTDSDLSNPAFGGGGGGGRVLIITADGTLASGSLADNFVNVLGGTNEVSPPGQPGVKQLCAATFTVTTTADSGAGSLRQAVMDANVCPGSATITFAPSAYGTITLTNGELFITNDLSILGPGVTNVTVNGNHTSRVFYINPSNTVTIAGLTITNGNVGGQLGGAIRNDHATLTVSNCVITGSSAADGGGILNDGNGGRGASLTIINSTLSHNFAVETGGGIYSDGQRNTTTLSVIGSSISDNSAGDAAGIFNRADSGTVTALLLDSTVSGNSATGNGGGLWSATISGTNELMVINSTFSSNVASNHGGAIVHSIDLGASRSTLTILNSTFSANSSPDGASIVNLGKTNVGIQATLQIGSTILNAANSGIISNSFGSIVSLGYNLSSDSGGGFLDQSTDLTNSNPMLGPLQDNGGPTFTHGLLCDSPALDAGTNFLNLANDQRGPGFPRSFDSATDIGAFEGTQQSCNQPPVALCTNVTVSAGTNCMADASIDNGSFDPDVGDSITNNVQSPVGPYSLGTNTVVLTVTDSHGSSSSCTGLVFVVDTTPPIIHCPTNMVTTNDSGQCSAVVNYAVSADDNCSSVDLSEDFPSGSTFSKGTNTVTVTGVDLAGNTNTCTFTITVVDKEAPLVMCRPAPNPSGKVSEPGKGGNINPNGYYQLLAKDNCDANPAIYVKDTKSGFVAGPFKDGDIVRLKHAGGAASSVAGTVPVAAVISLKGNGLGVAQDADGNRTADASGCVMAVSVK